MPARFATGPRRPPTTILTLSSLAEEPYAARGISRPEGAMSTSRVVVYSTGYCGYCRRAEALLRREGIVFETIDVTYDRPARAKLVERAHGRRTVPVIFIDGEPIGGYQELASLIQGGGLKHISTAPGQTVP